MKLTGFSILLKIISIHFGHTSKLQTIPLYPIIATADRILFPLFNFFNNMKYYNSVHNNNIVVTYCYVTLDTTVFLYVSSGENKLNTQ